MIILWVYLPYEQTLILIFHSYLSWELFCSLESVVGVAAWESKHIVNLELIISGYLWHHFIVKSLQKTPNTVCIDLHKGNANARVALVFHGPQGNPLGQCSEHIIRFLIPQSFDMAPVKCVLSAISVVFKFHVLPSDIHIGFFS